MRLLFIKEVVFWLQKPVTYVYLLAFSGLAFLGMAGSMGLFDPHNPNAVAQYLNSGYELNAMLQYLMKLVLFVLPAILGLSIYRDFSSGSFQYLYSYPISKWRYLLSRYTGAIVIVIIVVFFLMLGALVGELVPGLDPSKLGPLKFSNYVYFFFLIAVPNVLMIGALIFIVVAVSRNIYAGFTIILLLIALQSIIENAFGDYPYLIALFDPFAENTIGLMTRYWSLEDRNVLDLPLASVLFFNRIFWLGIVGGISTLLYARFSLGVQVSRLNLGIFKRTQKQHSISSKAGIDMDNIVLATRGYLKRVFSKMITWDVKYVLTHWIFLILVGFAIASFFFAITKVTNRGDFHVLPVTKLVLYLPMMFFGGISTMITFLYGGLLVSREKMAGIDQLTNASVTPTYVFMLSKTVSLVIIQVVLLMVLFLTGIGIQLINGFYDIDFALYFQQLVLVLLPYLLVWTFVSVFIHTLIPNLYLALFILVMGWAGISGLSAIGVNTRLLLFNGDLILSYSDLSGYGAALYSFFLIKAYWFFFACICLILGYLLWNRGFTFSVKEKYQQLVRRLVWKVQVFLILAVSFFIFSGWLIYDGESNMVWSNSMNQSKMLEEFHEKYDELKGLPQPKITSIDLNLDIYPEEYRFEAQGAMWLQNNTKRKIDTLLIRTSFDEISIVNPENAVLIDEDSLMHFHVYRLKKSLQVGKTLRVDFQIKNLPNTVFEVNSNVRTNATLLKSDILPHIGYLRGNKVPSPLDIGVRQKHYQADDSDLVILNTVISTSKTQRAIAPGRLLKEWEEKGRKHFKYKAATVKSSFAFHSGDWQLTKTDTLNIPIENYHEKSHDYNLEEMSNGVAAALTHNQSHYGGFEHDKVRIVEFPDSEGTYASLFANNMAVSEARYIANTDTASGAVPITFYIAAHELTHHWWGGQVMPAHAEGALMISESITEYNTLNIYRHHFGEQKADDFLQLQRERYLRGRTRETKEERPLAFVLPEQQYIAYGKGAMVFNALAHYIGNDSLKAILNVFLQQNRLAGPPYPTSLDLVALIKNAVPDSLSPKVSEIFEVITLHEVSVLAASKSIKKGAFTIDAQVSYNKKIIENEQLETGKLDFDWVEIGIYDKKDRLVEIRSIKMVLGNNDLVITGLTFEPSKIEIDPNLLMIDKDLKDNVFWL